MSLQKQRPTIGFLWHGDRNLGGGEYSTWLLARSLPPEFQPVLFYGNHNPLVEQYAHDSVRVEPITLNPCITGVYRDSISRNPIRWLFYTWHGLKAVVEVVRVIRRNQISILHPVDNLSKLIGGVAGRAAGVKVVAHCRDELGRTNVERLLLWYQSIFMHRIIAVAGRIQDLFQSTGCRREKVVTIYNGVDLGIFDPQRVQRASDVDWTSFEGYTVLAIIATFDRCKGHTYLFQACERLKQMGVTRWRCLVVGDGRERDALTREVSERGLGDEVVFLGYRSNVPQILKGINVIVIPSEQEAFPRVALESMAMQVPVVASQVGGLPEAIEHGRTGFIIPPRDVDALAKALEVLIKSPARRQEMGIRGRQRAERLFSLEENVRRTKQVYLEVLGLT